MNKEKQAVRVVDKRTVELILPNELGYERIAMACSEAFARMFGLVQARIEDELQREIGEEETVGVWETPEVYELEVAHVAS